MASRKITWVDVDWLKSFAKEVQLHKECLEAKSKSDRLEIDAAAARALRDAW